MKRFLLVSAAVGALAIAPNAIASTAHASTGTVVSLTRGGVLVAGGSGTVSFFAAHARVGARNRARARFPRGPAASGRGAVR